VPVVTGPGHQGAGAAGRGRLRTSRADREQVVEVLKAAFVEDRLTKDEFDTRVGQALASRTYADLAALTADIPAGLSTALPPEPARTRGRIPVGARVLTAATVPTAGLWAGALSAQTGNQALSGFVATFTCIWLGIVILTVAVMLESRRQKRSSGQRPPRPTVGPGGQASRLAGRFPQVERGQQHIAEAARPGPGPWPILGW
jgi:Domain of unknown function (DUF1707)